MIDYLLFDLDNTLYPASCGLGLEMNRRMSVFVADYLDVDLATAEELRRAARERYGTTLGWLRAEHALEDVDPYMDAVHPENLTPWITDAHADEAQSVLGEIDLPAAILTNGPREHAERVLERLGIARRFDRLFDLRENNFEGKPAISAYRKVLDELAIRPESTLFVDDMVQYLLPFRDLGGMIVHMSASGSAMPQIPAINTLRDLVHIIYPKGSRG
ncbi:MAG: HAD family hydrolase [Spirochaetota bacterium]